MRNVEIKVFPIAKSCLSRDNAKEWLDHIGAKDYEIPTSISDLALISGLAAKRCYMSFEPGLNPNVTKVRKDWCNFFDNILKSGHGSVLEHITYTWAIEGVTRVFTGEMNRHRAGVAISEGSMRYIRFHDIPFWKPTSLSDDVNVSSLEPEEPTREGWEELNMRKKITFEVMNRVFQFVEDNYSYLVDKVWNMNSMKSFVTKKKITSLIRRIIPIGVSTGGVWTINLRAIRHIMALRCSEAAEEEICYVWSLIGKYMVENEPLICSDFQEINGYWVPKYPKV